MGKRIIGGLAGLAALLLNCGDIKPRIEKNYTQLNVSSASCEDNLQPEVRFGDFPRNPRIYERVNFSFNFTDDFPRDGFYNFGLNFNGNSNLVSSETSGRVSDDEREFVIPYSFDSAGKRRVWVNISDGCNVASDFADVGVFDRSAGDSDNVYSSDINNPPEVSITYPLDNVSINEGENVNVRIYGIDSDGDNLEFEVNCGNGDVFAGADSSNVINRDFNCLYNDEGAYNIEASISDGEITSSDSLEVLVSSVNNPPSVSITNADFMEVLVGDEVNLSWENYDLDGDLLESKLNCDNGVIYGWDRMNNGNCVYSEEGSYNPSVEVRDGNGGYGSDNIDVDVGLPETYILDVPEEITLQRDTLYCFNFVKDLCPDDVLRVMCGDVDYAPGHSFEGFLNSGNLVYGRIFRDYGNSLSGWEGSCGILEYSSVRYEMGDNAINVFLARDDEGNEIIVTTNVNLE